MNNPTVLTHEELDALMEYRDQPFRLARKIEQAVLEKVAAQQPASASADAATQEPIGYLRNERGESTGKATLDPLFLLGAPIPNAYVATYSPVYLHPVPADVPKGEPSDGEITRMAFDDFGIVCDDSEAIAFARALLARYAAPADTSAQDAMQKGFDYGKAYAAQDAAAIRNAALEQVAEAIEAANEKAGDAAAYDNREMHHGEMERMHALTEAAAIARSLKTDQQEKGNG